MGADTALKSMTVHLRTTPPHMKRMHAEELPALRAEAAEAEAALRDAAVQLSAARRRASGHLRQAVEESLSRLAMQQSRFDVRIGWEAAAAADGGEGIMIGRDLADTVGALRCAQGALCARNLPHSRRCYAFIPEHAPVQGP